MTRRSRPFVTPSTNLLHQLSRLAAERVPLVVVTVVKASGSAPGKSGAKMVVTARAAYGTVGGGRVENAALEHARSLLGKHQAPEVQHIDVVQDLGMTCGGSMEIMYETQTPPPRLVIFGAGHIAEPLCAAAVLAGFDVTVCDDREDWLTKERFPSASALIQAPPSEAVSRAALNEHTFVTSVAPGHSVDQEIMLAIAAGGVRPRYVGVIGSRRKGVELRKGLLEKGTTESFVESIHIPMGLNIGAAEPNEIAISIVAELVAEFRNMNPVKPW
ncbi:MAG: hypothetical protein HKN21_10180 [Candidatus Eisenbacteria bacterium]|uniref:Xanthine dehydrogenase accessory protein XdhC n=1 Tax=Eiseniibacteriota bacterium TaxID=2212470 RepID=A0A7Y2H2K7_UNCEI|nr:hypothetical protein [Candidatus Eisenbacteria bacterium]